MSCSVAYCDNTSTEYYNCIGGHSIHKECARQWALSNPNNYSCPMCRAPMIPPSIFSEREARQFRLLQGRANSPQEAIDFADDVLAEADRVIARKQKPSWRDVAEIVAYIPPVMAFIYWMEKD